MIFASVATAPSLRITILAGKSSLIAAWCGSGATLAHDAYTPLLRSLKDWVPRVLERDL